MRKSNRTSCSAFILTPNLGVLPSHPVLVSVNHLHLLINGAYSSGELGFDDERFAMLWKLLNQTYPEELACSECLAESMARMTGLPPYRYSGSNAKCVGHSGYVWARNLLANRLYECPVIFIEAYVINSQEFFAPIPGRRIRRCPKFWRCHATEHFPRIC